MFKAGVYRDLHGETLCDPCDDDRDREQRESQRSDYGRTPEPIGEMRRKRESYRGAA